MRSISITEVMQTKVIVSNQNDSVASVEAKFRLNRIRHLPIVNDAGVLVGILTYRDLLSYVQPRHTEEGWVFDASVLNQFILKHMITQAPTALASSDTIAHAVEIMVRDKYGCVPIVDAQNKLCGIVTQIDILKWLGKKLGEGMFT